MRWVRPLVRQPTADQPPAARREAGQSRAAWTLAVVAAGGYLVFAAVWIVAGDQLVLRIAGDSVELLATLQSAKGLAFLCLTTAILFLVALGIARRLGNALAEARRAEDDLRAVQERLELALRASEVGLWDCDLVTGTVYRSPEWKQQLGYGEAELTESRAEWQDRLHPEDRERVLAEFDRAIREGDEHYEQEFRLRHKNGSWRWIVSRGRVFRDARGRAVRMRGSHLDITERKETEAQLRQAQKMEAIGQLTGGIAHDFNNLLTVVIGNVSMLQSRFAGDPKISALLDLTRSAADKAAALTSRLLLFGRRSPLAPQPTDPNQLIVGLTSLIVRTIGEPYQVRTSLDPRSWNVAVDPRQLENALLNLAINARDAMPQGGPLTIETANVTVEGPQPPGLDLAPGDYVRISLTDAGTGMTPEVQSRAFDPFFTTKGEGRGSGLGLSMVYGLARQSGGDARIYSEPGYGTTVALYLPRALTDAAAPPAAEPAAPALKPGAVVLVVEDEHLVRRFLVMLLRDIGFTPVACSDGPSALGWLDGGHRPDLLITDMVLPGGNNGVAVARAARMRVPGLPVLIVSGYARDAVADPAGLAGNTAFLQKPFQRRELEQRLGELLRAGAERSAA